MEEDKLILSLLARVRTWTEEGEKNDVLRSSSTSFKYTVTEAEYLTAMDKHIVYAQISVWTLHYLMLTLRHFHNLNKIQL